MTSAAATTAAVSERNVRTPRLHRSEPAGTSARTEPPSGPIAMPTSGWWGMRLANGVGYQHGLGNAQFRPATRSGEMEHVGASRLLERRDRPFPRLLVARWRTPGVPGGDPHQPGDAELGQLLDCEPSTFGPMGRRHHDREHPGSPLLRLGTSRHLAGNELPGPQPARTVGVTDLRPVRAAQDSFEKVPGIGAQGDRRSVPRTGQVDVGYVAHAGSHPRGGEERIGARHDHPARKRRFLRLPAGSSPRRSP